MDRVREYARKRMAGTTRLTGTFIAAALVDLDVSSPLRPPAKPGGRECLESTGIEGIWTANSDVGEDPSVASL